MDEPNYEEIEKILESIHSVALNHKKGIDVFTALCIATTELYLIKCEDPDKERFLKIMKTYYDHISVNLIKDHVII